MKTNKTGLNMNELMVMGGNFAAAQLQIAHRDIFGWGGASLASAKAARLSKRAAEQGSVKT